MGKINQQVTKLANECRNEGRPLLLATDNGLTDDERKLEFKLIGKGKDLIELVANALNESESFRSVFYQAANLYSEWESSTENENDED